MAAVRVVPRGLALLLPQLLLLSLPTTGSLRPSLAGVWRRPPPLPAARQPPPVCQDVAEEKQAPRSTSDVALAFGAALSAAWAGGEMRLGEIMRADCRVETPVWSCEDRAAYEADLSEARSFFSALSSPALTVLSHRQLEDGRAQLTWMLGVEWPAAWRPRINILGESVLTIDAPAAGGTGAARVTRVVETWHEAPLEVFLSQALPKFRDVASLWATPTAEHLPMRAEGGGDGFELRRLPPFLALQTEWIETGELVLAEQAPLPPYYAFTGEVKRREWYSTTSPGILERSFCTHPLPGGMSQPGQRRRWISPLPTRFGADPSALASLDDALRPRDDDSGAFEKLPPEVVSASVQYVRRPSQLLATRRLWSIPSNTKVLTAALELAKAAEKAGYAVVRREGRPVVVQLSGDVKYGYNADSELAMSAWLSVPDALRDEYVAVIIDEGGGADD